MKTVATEIFEVMIGMISDGCRIPNSFDDVNFRIFRLILIVVSVQ